MGFPTWFWVATGVALALVVCVDVSLLLIWGVNYLRVQAGKAKPIFSRTWSLVDAWAMGQVVIVAVAAMASVGSLGMTFAFGAPPLVGPMCGPWMYFMLGVLALQALIFASGPMVLIRYRYGVCLPEIGLKWLPSRKDVVRGVLWGGVALVVGAIVEAGLTWCLTRWLPRGVYASLSSVSSEMSIEHIVPGVRATRGALALLLLVGGLLVPFGEEVLFRGLIYNSAKRRLGVAGGLIVSAVVFALAHGGPLLVLAIIPMGLLIAWVYERSGSLWTTVFLHATNNLVGLVAAYYGKG